MSELQRAFAKAKISGFPPPEFDEADEEDEDEADGIGELPVEGPDDDSSSASSASSASSTGTIIPSPNMKLFARSQG